MEIVETLSTWKTKASGPTKDKRVLTVILEPKDAEYLLSILGPNESMARYLSANKLQTSIFRELLYAELEQFVVNNLASLPPRPPYHAEGLEE